MMFKGRERESVFREKVWERKKVINRLSVNVKNQQLQKYEWNKKW